MVKNKLLICLVIIISIGSFAPQVIAGIKSISATPSQLIVEPDTKTSGSLRLVEFPAYYGCGYDTPEPDMSQGWFMGGYSWPTGGKMDFKDGRIGIYNMTFT